MLLALAGAPPPEDPISITMVDDRLRISTMAIACAWESASTGFIRVAFMPDYLDLLAMDRTLSRTEIHGTGLARKISTARSTIAGRVAKAAKLLEVADISAQDLEALVEQKLGQRIKAKGG